MTDWDLSVTTQLSRLTCGTCSIPFAIPAPMHERVKQSGDWFYCPNGHRIHYYEAENDALRKKLERQERVTANISADVERAREQRDAANRRAVALKGVVTRTKKRIAHGKCPCCHATFKNLAEHMGDQHPGYGQDEQAK